MGNLQNADTGRFYEKEYCIKCLHYVHGLGCPVMGIHLMCRAEREGIVKQILDMLIPVELDYEDMLNDLPTSYNAECKMFLDRGSYKKVEPNNNYNLFGKED